MVVLWHDAAAWRQVWVREGRLKVCIVKCESWDGALGEEWVVGAGDWIGPRCSALLMDVVKYYWHL